MAVKQRNIVARYPIKLLGVDMVMYRIPTWVTHMPEEHDLWIAANYLEPDLVMRYLEDSTKRIRDLVIRIEDSNISIPLFSLQALMLLGIQWETPDLVAEAVNLILTYKLPN